MNQKPTSYVLAALGFLPVFAFAVTPILSSVLGTVQQGQTLTLTGTSMVQEDQTNWDAWFKTTHPNASGMEGASPAADGYDTSISAPALEYVTSVKLMGSKSMHLHDQGVYSWPPGDGRRYVIWPQAVSNQSGLPKDVYFRMYTRWNWNEWPRTGGTNNNSEFKYFWQGSDANPYRGLFWNFEPNGGSAPTRFGYTDGINPYRWANIPGGAIQNNRWYCIEVHSVLDNNGNNAPYVAEAWIDNQLLFSDSRNWGVSTTAAGWAMHVNYWAMTSAFVGDTWDDGMALSTTRVRPASLIEIGNSSNYATGTKVYQAPEFLSDDLAQIKVNLTGLGAGPYFLWVTNNRGERSLAFGLSSSPLPAPLNLRLP